MKSQLRKSIIKSLYVDKVGTLSEIGLISPYVVDKQELCDIVRDINLSGLFSKPIKMQFNEYNVILLSV